MDTCPNVVVTVIYMYIYAYLYIHIYVFKEYFFTYIKKFEYEKDN